KTKSNGEEKKSSEKNKPAAGKGKIAAKKEEPTTNSEGNHEVKIGSVTLQLSNQNRIYFPDDGITKGELVNYYNEISSFILPYLKDRPQSLNRYPNGIYGQSFYQKDMSKAKLPKWIPTEKIYSESNEEYI